jgi:SAM-dependent methyltransferase
MERICEPELMDEPAQARAYAEADFSASDQALVERLVELFGAGSALGTRIVDLGCGPGNITFLLAEHVPEATVLGLDGAAAMLAIAEQRRQALAEVDQVDPRQTSGAERLQFQKALLPLEPDQALRLRAAATGGNVAGAGFSAVVSNSLLHHLHDPAVLWTTVRLLAAPGAVLYLQDLRRPASPVALEALVASQMATAPEVLRRDYRHSLHAAFTPEEVTTQLEQAGLGGLRVQERGERYLEVWGRLPLTATSAA